MTDIAKSTGMRLRVQKRKHEPDVDFRIVIAPIGTFQTLVSTVHCLLNDVHFFVIKNKDFEGIKVDSSTLDNTTMLKQQLSCTVDLPDGIEEINFCVNVSQLNSRIKNGNASAFAAVIGAQAEIKKINQEKERVLSMGIKLVQKGDFKLPDPLVI